MENVDASLGLPALAWGDVFFLEPNLHAVVDLGSC